MLDIVQGGQCVWKTTTLAQAGDLKVGRDRDAAAVAAAQRHGWLVSDAWGATHAAKMQLGDGIYIDPVRNLVLHQDGLLLMRQLTAEMTRLVSIARHDHVHAAGHLLLQCAQAVHPTTKA